MNRLGRRLCSINAWAEYMPNLNSTQLNNFVLDESIFLPKIVVIKRSKNQLIKQTSISIEPCSFTDKPENSELDEYFATNPIIGMYCIKDYNPIQLEGSVDSSLYELEEEISDLGQSQEGILGFLGSDRAEGSKNLKILEITRH